MRDIKRISVEDLADKVTSLPINKIKDWRARIDSIEFKFENTKYITDFHSNTSILINYFDRIYNKRLYDFHKFEYERFELFTKSSKTFSKSVIGDYRFSISFSSICKKKVSIKYNDNRIYNLQTKEFLKLEDLLSNELEYFCPVKIGYEKLNCNSEQEDFRNTIIIDNSENKIHKDNLEIISMIMRLIMMNYNYSYLGYSEGSDYNNYCCDVDFKSIDLDNDITNRISFKIKLNNYKEIS